MLWLKNNERGHRVRVPGSKRVKHLFRQLFSGLDQHGGLVPGFDGLLPAIDRQQPRKNIYTGCELLFHKFLPYFPGVVFAWKCGINDDHSSIFTHAIHSNPRSRRYPEVCNRSG